MNSDRNQSGGRGKRPRIQKDSRPDRSSSSRDFDSRKKTCGISQIRFNTEGDLVVSKIFENTTAANKHIKINQKIYSIKRYNSLLFTII